MQDFWGYGLEIVASTLYFLAHPKIFANMKQQPSVRLSVWWSNRKTPCVWRVASSACRLEVVKKEKRVPSKGTVYLSKTWTLPMTRLPQAWQWFRCSPSRSFETYANATFVATLQNVYYKRSHLHVVVYYILVQIVQSYQGITKQLYMVLQIHSLLST